MKSIKGLENQRWFIWTIVFLVVTGVSLTTYTWYVGQAFDWGVSGRWIMHSPKTAINAVGGNAIHKQPNQTSTISPNFVLPPIQYATSTADTTNWKTYSNSIFEFKYPSNWQVSDLGGGAVPGGELSIEKLPIPMPQDCEGDCPSYGISIGVQQINSPTDFADFLKNENGSHAITPEEVQGFEMEQINGQTAYHIQYGMYNEDDTVIYHNGYQYIISDNFFPGADGSETTELLEIAHGIISTFKLIQ
jgi:hypothetical protein